MMIIEPEGEAMAACKESGCHLPARVKGLCSKHYQRRRAGSPPTPVGTQRGEPMAFARAALTVETADCILWPYSCGRKGYGNLYADGASMHVHRWVCRAAHGEPPSPDDEARHSCHVPACVNPAHLSWGTHAENMHDSIRAGRNAVGQRHTSARLTDDAVTSIRQSELPDTVWAERLGIKPQTVAGARSGRTWKHVATPPRRNIKSASAKYREQIRRRALS